VKRISPSTVTVGMLAILFGLVAAYGARRLFEPAPPVDPRVEVVVPRINLPKYARIREQDVELVKLDPSAVPAGAVHSRQLALYRTVRETLLAGQPITEAALYGVGETPTLAEQLPAGYRAVTIAVDRINALGGLLLPESYVDIALTVNSTHPDLQGIATKTILRHVKVLATSQQRFKSEERMEPEFRSVTVAVTPEDANKLILAQQHGTLSVTLRGEHDDEVAANDGDLANVYSLLGIDPIRRPQHKAEVWRGSTMQEVTFGAARIREAERATLANQNRQPLARSASRAASPAAGDSADEPLAEGGGN
jgi:pilus assembly protein CpaB